MGAGAQNQGSRSTGLHPGGWFCLETFRDFHRFRLEHFRTKFTRVRPPRRCGGGCQATQVHLLVTRILRTGGGRASAFLSTNGYFDATRLRTDVVRLNRRPPQQGTRGRNVRCGLKPARRSQMSCKQTQDFCCHSGGHKELWPYRGDTRLIEHDQRVSGQLHQEQLSGDAYLDARQAGNH